MTAKRKGLIAFLSIMLVLVISAGLTFAYLTGSAGEAENVFKFSDNIRGQINEPNWDPEAGKNMKPGMEIRKDPMITNTSDNGVSEYAAIMVTFKPGDDASYDSGDVLTDEDTAKLLGLIDIDWNDDEWTLIGAYGDDNTWTAVSGGNETTVKAMNNQVWVYNTAIVPGEITTPLYNSITIHSEMDDVDMTWLSGVALDHDPSCWEFNEECDCTPTYKHHAGCALSKAVDSGVLEADAIAAVEQGGSLRGTDSQDYVCDCTPVEQHESDCASLVGTLKGDCGHTVEGSICGFKITNSGAILQADQFVSATDSATVNAFAELFKA